MMNLVRLRQAHKNKSTTASSRYLLDRLNRVMFRTRSALRGNDKASASTPQSMASCTARPPSQPLRLFVFCLVELDGSTKIKDA
jgi:hypothetical protein